MATTKKKRNATRRNARASDIPVARGGRSRRVGNDNVEIVRLSDSAAAALDRAVAVAGNVADSPRAGTRRTSPNELEHLGYTAAGAVGTAFLGGVLARQNWQPTTIAAVLATAGGVLAWSGKSPAQRQVGTGTMAAGTGQLALLLLRKNQAEQAKLEVAKKLAEEQKKLADEQSKLEAAKKLIEEQGKLEAAKKLAEEQKPAERRQAFVSGVRPGSLEHAFERARAHMRLEDDFEEAA